MKVALLTLAFAALSAGQTLKQEGGYWVQTTRGTFETDPARHLKITTRGGLHIQGADIRVAAWTLIKKVRAANEDDALRQVNAVVARSRRGALDILQPERSRVAVEVNAQVPANLSVVMLETQGGNVEAYDIHGAVEAESGGGLIQMDRIGGDATARTGGGEIRLGRVNGSVRCLSAGGSITVERAGAESWFETAGGEINIRETGGPIHATTAGGNIRVERAGAAVAAHTAGGRIEVHEAGGIVTAGNSAGSIQVGQAPGAQCESSNGTIRLRGTSGTLRAVTTAGSIVAEIIPGAHLQDSILSTGNGDVTVLIPSNFPVTIRAQNESGRSGKIVSDFREIPVRLVNASRRSSTLAEGSLNGGGPILKISASNGVIYLRRVQ